MTNLQDKKVAIVGMGVNNKKLSEYFKKHKIQFSVIDHWGNPDELIGKFDGFDVVFRSPGLPYLSEAIQKAKHSGVEISSQTKLFFELCPAKIIGVTGTKGKGTTSSLIAKILEESRKKVWLGGNIGTDPFEFMEQIKPDDLVVLELSSFQLQDLEQSPHIAVVLSVTPDHLNHHKDFEEYLKAKSSILTYQKSEDFAILHSSLPDWFKDLGQGRKFIIDPLDVSNFETKLIGRHNLENIAAAVEVAKILGIDPTAMKKAISEFQPLPHRLQIVAEKNGVIFVDDSVSTNADSTIAALHSFTKPIILILGGSTKGLDYQKLGQAVREAQNLKAVVLIGEVASEIMENIQGFRGKILTGAKNMAEVVLQANNVAQSGDVVLLSPAAASFDMFKSYKDRGEQFISEVNRL